MQNVFMVLANDTIDLEGNIKAFSIRAVLIATLLLVTLIAISIFVIKNKQHEKLKLPLFIAISATIILPTILLMGSTIYVNVVSESKGPVHWHSDIEFWACGQEIELRDPTGFFSNKIGSSTYHEHDDKRIHLEGVVIEKAYDASLEKFMDVSYGKIDQETLIIATSADGYIENDIDGDVPTGSADDLQQYIMNDSEGLPVVSLKNGDTCKDEQGNEQPGEVQAFLYRFDKLDDTYTQTKLEDPKSYVVRDESVVPPGDCIIVEFSIAKDTTDRLCEQFGVRDADRCTEFGVTQFNPDLCNIRQVDSLVGGEL